MAARAGRAESKTQGGLKNIYLVLFFFFCSALSDLTAIDLHWHWKGVVNEAEEVAFFPSVVDLSQVDDGDKRLHIFADPARRHCELSRTARSAEGQSNDPSYSG